MNERPATTGEPEKPKDFDRYWLKIFNDIQTDMRFVTMSYEHQGIYLNLLVLANHAFGVGRIVASRDELARALRISRLKLDKVLSEIEMKSLAFVEGNTIQIADERHYNGPGLNLSDAREAKNERMRKSRAATKQADLEQQRVAVRSDSHEWPARGDETSEGKTSRDETSGGSDHEVHAYQGVSDVDQDGPPNPGPCGAFSGDECELL